MIILSEAKAFKNHIFLETSMILLRSVKISRHYQNLIIDIFFTWSDQYTKYSRNKSIYNVSCRWDVVPGWTYWGIWISTDERVYNEYYGKMWPYNWNQRPLLTILPNESCCKFSGVNGCALLLLVQRASLVFDSYRRTNGHPNRSSYPNVTDMSRKCGRYVLKHSLDIWQGSALVVFWWPIFVRCNAQLYFKQ
jgi:hypothetical protein